MKRILIIEDDPDILDIVSFNLKQEGYAVDTATDGEEGILAFAAKRYDLILLDIMIPKLSGLEVLDAIRLRSDVPVLIMSARTAEEDRLAGLARMADDYICKPFSMREMIARIKVHLNRYQKGSKSAAKLQWGELEIDEEQMMISVRGKTLSLTKKELQLLLLFAASPGKIFSREDLMRLIWGYSVSSGEDRTVDVAVRRLREKIEADPANPRYILSRRGVGYQAGEIE